MTAEVHANVTSLFGVYAFESPELPDERGWFIRAYSDAIVEQVAHVHIPWLEENHSRSTRGVVRGLHFRADLTEAKFVRVARGEVFDVVVDLRPWSETFLHWESFILNDSTHRAVLIPPGCAHGIQCVSTEADLLFRVSAVYDASLDCGILWRDEDLGIPWPHPNEAALSERDRRAPTLRELAPSLVTWFGRTPS